MPQEKELHFFYVNYSRGLAWYESQFAEAGSNRARGEISPDYLYHEAALRNIAADLPGVKLFAILRNPMERAYSQYLLHRHRFEGKTFVEVCVPGSELFDRGLYYERLCRLSEIFSPDQVKVLFYDDLAAKPAEFVSELYEFIGVDPTFRPPSLGKTYNRIIFPGIQKTLISMRAGWLIEALKNTTAGDYIRRRHSNQVSPVAAYANSMELRRLYKPDITLLSQMVGRDLSHWLV